jgi:HAD superfamily hydrolase (TIGR01509 family)
MIKAIIFDVDGTLSETEEIHRISFNRAFGIHDLSWYWSRQEYRRLLDVSGGKERIRFYMNTNPDAGLLIGDMDQYIRSVHATKTEVYTQLVSAGKAILRPGIRDLLDLATRQEIRMAIATTTSMPNVEALLKANLGSGGMALFETICAGDSVAKKKPAPDVYLDVLDKMGLKPADCLAIEDSRNGLLSATQAGIPTVVTPGIYTSHHRFDEAVLVTQDLGASIAGYLQ